ncbi:hypothetical protein ACFE04_032010 [Oxalis oulophora]
MAIKNILISTFVVAFFGVSLAAVYNVGDSAGWSAGIVDYNKWASKYTFHVGDTIVFKYNNQAHNMERVTRQNYAKCNKSSPINVHTSGSDSIILKKPGHIYFICSKFNLCQLGQKVDILVKW